jgi:hypothetical protein
VSNSLLPALTRIETFASGILIARQLNLSTNFQCGGKVSASEQQYLTRNRPIVGPDFLNQLTIGTLRISRSLHLGTNILLHFIVVTRHDSIKRESIRDG